MDNKVYSIIRDMRDLLCDDCDLYDECATVRDYNCCIKQILNRIADIDTSSVQENNEGCFICNNKKNKTVFYDDGRGGLKIAEFCPNCGKKITN